MTIQSISLCNADPMAPFSSELAAAWAKGAFTEAAVAFLTEGGVDFFAQNCLSHQDRSRCRLCFAVQWPTNLDAVARLSPLLGPNLRIHLGAKTPVEAGTDVTPMLHSKAIYVDHGDGQATAFVGSHNWTGNALNGINCEASVRTESSSSDPFALDLRNHLDECFRRCVPFDPNDLNFYKAVQRALSMNRPPSPDAERVSEFEGLEGAPAVIIHAEGDEAEFRANKQLLFLPVKDRSIAKWFSTTTPTSVFLFLYPVGTLFGKEPPSSRPILLSGPVGTNNDVQTSPSREQDVTCQIRSLEKPELRCVTDGNIPALTDELYQVVAELRRLGTAEVPIYHRGRQPMLAVGARFEEQPAMDAITEYHDLDDEVENFEIARVGNYDADSIREGAFIYRKPSPERVVQLDVPEQWLYPEDVSALVRRRLDRKSGADSIRIALKPRQKHNAYVYRADYVLPY